MVTIALVFLAGMIVALLWPGNPGNRAVLAVTGSIDSTLRRAG